MASTFSPSLRLELIGDGDQSGIWGQTTNNNLGALIEQAIAGVITITMVDANYTMTNFNGVSDEARNQVIVLTGTNTAQRNLIAPLVEKTYTVKNSTTGGFAVQIIGSSGTGVLIPNGTTASVYCDGTNFLPLNTGSVGNFSVSGNLAVTGTTTLTGATTLSSTLAVTGATTFTGIPSGPTAAPGTNTTQLATTAFVAGVTGALGTMSTQNANNVSITGGTISGLGTALPVASGGTGAATLTANNVLLGNGTSAVQAVAPSTSGNVLTSNGTTWTSAALPVLEVGVGQTWQLPGRSAGTTYTNSTGRPIQVHVVVQANSGNGQSSNCVVGGVTIGSGSTNNVSGGAGTTTYSFIVPNGTTYAVNIAGPGTVFISSWAELR